MKKKNVVIIVKFLLFLTFMTLLGGVIGYSIRENANTIDYESIFNSLLEIMDLIGIIVTALSVLLAATALAIIILCRLKIDKVDEDRLEALEERLDFAAIPCELSIILNLLGFSCLVTSNSINDILFITFFVMLFFYIFNTVMLTSTVKKLNPEKTANALDLRFHKEYLKTCDEAERAKIGHASYISYRATTNTIVALWVISSILSMIADIGIFPVLILSVIWIVHYLSFAIAANKKER